MPRASVETSDPGPDPVRVCAECNHAKTIRGVWYMVPGRGVHPFVCETCFSSKGSMRALS